MCYKTFHLMKIHERASDLNIFTWDSVSEWKWMGIFNGKLNDFVVVIARAA